MKRWRLARRRTGERKRKWPQWTVTARVSLGVFTWAALGLILAGYDVFPGRLSLKAGDISPTLVRAPRTAQFVDREETTRLREEAARRVLPVYVPLRFARADAGSRVKHAFAVIAAVRLKEGSAEALRTNLEWLPLASATAALAASPHQLRVAEQVAQEALRELMSRQLRDETSDLRVARADAPAFLAQRVRDDKLATLATAVVTHELAATYHLDRDATTAARKEARERVQEVVRTIEADQPIIFEGERVSAQQLEMLRALGLTSPQFNARRVLAIALIVAFIVLLLGLQTRQWARGVFADPKRLLLLSLLTVASLFVISLLTLSLPNVWMLMAPATALMAAALLGDSVGLALALSLSLLVGLMANGGLPATLLSLGSAVTALTFVSQLWPLSRLRVLVATTAAVNLVMVAAMSLLREPQAGALDTAALLAAVLYAPGAAVLALGGIYVLQRPFGITTHLSLLELSNPQTPLLRRLQTEAPGTYHHSIMVASLAEAVADTVGADTLLTRVGALYHDVGKLSRPGFFVENQALLGVDNAHERLSSSLSGLIIISHVKDGVELVSQHGLPREICDIVEQHHGEMTMSYFYHQALSEDRPEQITEEQFRYPGPLPNTREAAIVMLADGVHAATKSISEPTPQRIQQVVREIFRERLVGRQLEQCDLTFRQLAVAETAIARVLTAALCRDRIAYPTPAEERVEV